MTSLWGDSSSRPPVEQCLFDDSFFALFFTMSYSIGLKLKVFATISKQNSSFRVDDVTGWRVRLHEELCSGRFPWERLSWVLPTTWPWTCGTRRSCPWPEKKQINNQVASRINSEEIRIPEVYFINSLLALRLIIRPLRSTFEKLLRGCKSSAKVQKLGECTKQFMKSTLDIIKPD